MSNSIIKGIKATPPPAPIDLEKLGPAILKLQDAFANARRIAKDKLLVLLLHDMTGVGKREIQTILDAIPNMSRTYLKPCLSG